LAAIIGNMAVSTGAARAAARLCRGRPARAGL